MPNGRLMVNCGGINEASVMTDGMLHPRTSSIDDTWVQNSTIKSLTKAFPGKVWILPLIMCYVPLISLLLHLVFLNGYTIV